MRAPVPPSVLLSLLLPTACLPESDDTGTAERGGNITLEACDGLDNDGDRVVDEGFPDVDNDGIADCVDEETCDGLDNDADGSVDETFADGDVDGVADCVDEEECDGVDNDGDGDIDEGFDLDGEGTADCLQEVCNCDDDDGDGEVDEGLDCSYPITLNASADDYLSVYFDGVAAGSRTGWNNLFSQTWTVPAGTYPIAVFARDQGFSAVGYNARVTVPGAGPTDYDTASGVWRVTHVDPTPTYGTAWTTGAAASVMSSDAAYVLTSYCLGRWTHSPSGAPWVWAESCNPYTYRRNWYYVEVDACPQAGGDDCDGVDNDLDGLTDEGFTDSDFDGVADCVEVEECNGWDDNLDGFVDEGFADTDVDGVADCVDAETCDGLDNDGDTYVDEGFGDSDLDAVADCVDTETCDGLDNDGDSLVDEGFGDSDLDRVPDCRDTEECDGEDNNGNGVVDEGFRDTDFDGVADCVDVEACDGVDNDGDRAVDEGYPDTDGDGTADCVDVETCDGFDNDGNGAVDEGYPDIDGDGTADCVDAEGCDGLDNDGDGAVDEGYSDSDGDGTADCLEPIGCGDGVWDSASEECDDGRTDDGDGCSALCTIEAGYTCLNALDINTGTDGMGARAAWGDADLLWTWSEYEDGTGSVPAVASGACASTWTTAPTIADWVNRYGCATTSPENRITYYSVSFDLGSASAASSIVLDGTMWADTEIVDVLVNGYSTGVTYGSPAFTGAGLPLGSWPSAYYQAGTNTITVAVYNDYGARWNPDGLLVYAPEAFSVASDCQPTCGAGIQETWELCDDGNDVDDDGCSALCESDELCNATDDDLDGFVDEGYPDTDADGLPDCLDEETCDGLDNDGDGLVDEDSVDTDADGVVDCLDTEICDGLDNDGDGLVDEIFTDANRNGVADCAEVEVCDCEDNDGDGGVDEDLGCTYDVTLEISADDEWDAWFDGASWGFGSSWSTLGTLTTTASSGSHTIAVYAYDTGGAQVGMNARVEVTGAAEDAWDTGLGLWLVSATSPSSYGASSTWTTTPYTGMTADSVYPLDPSCPYSWGYSGSGLPTTPSGGEWVWREDCTNPIGYPENWFLLELEVCPDSTITATPVDPPPLATR